MIEILHKEVDIEIEKIPKIMPHIQPRNQQMKIAHNR